jgi:predicted exporter
MTAHTLAPAKPWLAPVLWLVLMALAALQIARTPFTADLSAFLPANPDAQQRVLIEQLQSGVPARTLLIAIEGGDAKSRADASRALAQGLRSSGLFEQVQNGQTDNWAQVGEWLFKNRYALSPAVSDERFTPAGLRAAFAETLSLLGTPAGQATKPLLERDPTGETTRIAEALIPATAPRSEEGVWVSRQGERALLVAGTLAPGADLDAQALAIQKVEDEFAQLTPKPSTAANAQAHVLRISGAPVFGVQSRAQIEKEIHWLALAGTLLMSALLLVAFASLPALAVALLPVATGVVTGIAAVSLVFGGVHGITLGFGTTLIGEAVDYAIYYLIQARQGGWQHWLKTGWPTVRLGLLTSVCGFGALVFSGFPGLAQLGVFSLAGLVGAALFTRFVMPVLMPQGTGGKGLRAALGAFSLRAVAWLPSLRWPVLALGVAAALVLATRGDLWRAELSSLSPISKEALALDASLRADLSAGDARTLVVVQGADLQATLRAAEATGAVLDSLAEQGAIAGYDSVTRWLPSQATQQRRLASLPNEQALQQSLLIATQGTPLKPERLAPFVAEVQQARALPLLTPESLRGTGLSPLIDALLLQRKDGSWAALLPLQAAGDRLDGAAVRAALQSQSGTQVIEIGSELTRLYARYLREAQTQALLGALGVVLLMAATLRSLPRLLAVCQPLLLAVLLTMGTLAALGVQLGILHLVGLLLVVAVGSNYVLFFDMLRHQPLTKQRSAPPLQDTLASLLLANLTTVLGFGLIAMSVIPALAAIGRVVAPGALLALVLAAVFIPARSAEQQAL